MGLWITERPVFWCGFHACARPNEPFDQIYAAARSSLSAPRATILAHDPIAAFAALALLIGRQDHGHRLRMDRRNYRTDARAAPRVPDIRDRDLRAVADEARFYIGQLDIVGPPVA
jgi:hypothetical protein